VDYRRGHNVGRQRSSGDRAPAARSDLQRKGRANIYKAKSLGCLAVRVQTHRRSDACDQRSLDFYFWLIPGSAQGDGASTLLIPSSIREWYRIARIRLCNVTVTTASGCRKKGDDLNDVYSQVNSQTCKVTPEPSGSSNILLEFQSTTLLLQIERYSRLQFDRPFTVG